jgi:hypothetical protein
MVRQWLAVTCVAFLMGVVIFSTGCGGSGKTEMRVLQASPDETTGLDVLIDGNTLFSNVALDTVGSYASVSSGSRHLQVEPNGSTTPVIDETISLNGGTHYTLVTTNYAANISPVLLTDDASAPASGDFKIRVMNAGIGTGPSVDAYIVTPDTTPGSVAPTISAVTFGNASSYQSLAAGSYEIFFTLSGVPSVIYVDTGSLSFAAGQNRTIVLVPTAAGSFSYVALPDLN